MAETAQSFIWCQSVMLADSALVAAATGGIWQGSADVGTPPPFVTYNRQGGQDALNASSDRLFVHILLQIKAIGPNTNYAALVTLAGRIDALFKSVKFQAIPGGGSMLACWREQEIAYEEPALVNGVAWSHLGGIYHLEVSAT